jgi:PAS domain S-box-containing protein
MHNLLKSLFRGRVPVSVLAAASPREDATASIASVTFRYVLAVIVVAATLFVVFINVEFARNTPFLLFYPVPVLAFLWGGLGPGLLAAALSGLAVDYVLLPPYYTFGFHPTDFIRVATFCGIEATLCLLLDSHNKALRRSGTELDAILENVADGVFVSDLDGGLLYWNRAALTVHGFESHDQLPRNLREFVTIFELSAIDGTVLPLAEWPRARVLRGEELVEHEVRIRRLDRDWNRIFSYGGALVRDAKNRPLMAVVTVKDITRRRQAEEQVRRLNTELEQRVAARTAQLERSNRELEHFAYVASHDLQEPLRALSSFSQLLAQRYNGRLDTDAHEFIEFIIAAATRMRTLIDDLLAFSRIGTRGTAFAPVDYEAIVDTAKANLDAAIAESGAVITHDALPTLRADHTQLTQLFQNLFSNAIKFRRADESPRVHVSAARQDGAWRFSVRDNGIGIDPLYFDRIFVIFQRLHAREAYPGTGIGLAICKKIVERHSGRIWVESAPGSGSTFHFTIAEKGQTYDELGSTHALH